MNGILFDMDGVLVDVSNSYDRTICKTSAFFLKKEIDPKEIYKIRNSGGFNNDWDLTEEIINRSGKKISRKLIIKKFQEIYLNDMVQYEKWLLKKEILIKLRKNYKIGIVTGRPRAEAFYTLKKNKMDIYFQTVIAMEDVRNNKPAPEGLIRAKKKLSIDSGYYIGDTVDDIKAAVSAALTPIYLIQNNNTAFTQEFIKALGVEKTITDINKLMEVIDA